MYLEHARVLAFLVFGLFGGAAAAGQEGKDMKLEDVGFVMRPANTPAQIDRLRLLPAAHVYRPHQERPAILSLCRPRTIANACSWAMSSP